KPSTMVQTPLTWDGSGLLPGESLARHRDRKPNADAAEVLPELQGVFSDSSAAQQGGSQAIEDATTDDAIESTYLNPAVAPFQTGELVEEEFVEEEQPQESIPGAPAEFTPGAEDSDPFSDPFFTETRMAGEPEHGEGYAQEEHTGQPHGMPVGDDVIGHEPIEQPSTEVVADWLVPQKGDPDKPDQDAGTQSSLGDTEPEGDRSASHNVDPHPPSEFRLFGLGGKKKAEPAPSSGDGSTTATVQADQPAVKQTTPASSFSPGQGLVEEETIEGEEFDSPRHHPHRQEEGDLDDYEEEEKHRTAIRSGELGEMLQEAHLDHKIQLNFDDKNGEDGDVEIEDE